MEWTREERYQRIEDVDETYLEQLKHQVDTSLYRQTFHIQPEMGLLTSMVSVRCCARFKILV